MAKYDSYIICTSPRSGSTLLCNLLSATGVAGHPDSYFHQPSISGWLADLDLIPVSPGSEQDLLDRVFQTAISKGRSDTSIFGLRLQRHSFDFLMKNMALLFPGWSNDADLFGAAFGQTLFVHLTRLNKVAQAISYVKATQSGLWHAAPDGTELERLSPSQQPVYNADEIRATVGEMTSYDLAWEQWFAEEAIDPLRLTYEDLCTDPIETLLTVLDHLGLDRNAAIGIKPGVAKLADGTSRQWEARFRSEHVNT